MLLRPPLLAELSIKKLVLLIQRQISRGLFLYLQKFPPKYILEQKKLIFILSSTDIEGYITIGYILGEFLFALSLTQILPYPIFNLTKNISNQ